MAGTLYLRLTECPRTIFLLSGRNFYSIKTIGWRNSLNWQNKAAVQMLRRSIFMSKSKTTFPTLLQQICKTSRHRNCDSCRFLNYSCCKESSHSDSANMYSSGVRFDTKVDVKENIKHDKQIGDTELKTILKDLSRDFEDESTEVKNETSDLSDEELKQMKVTDTNKFDSSDVTNANNHTNFEYDYQVAEDIEEYDYIDENKLAEQQVRPEKVLPISLERGKDGVFCLDELVTLLQHLGAEDIVTFPVPHQANFCDHMVVVSAKSRRHLQAINDELLWVHKRKKSANDHHLVIEGIDKSDWCAMDLGNIVLHVFYGDAREYYNIESLWTLGPDRDPLCQESSVDPYALSPEDLFWLETGNSVDKVKDTANQDDRDVTGSDVKVKSAKTELDI